MTPVTNNKDLRDEENNHHHGHEIILHLMPNENEMATNHPEPEEEELDEEDEMEMHPDAGNTNRWRPGWSRSRALTAFLATAGVGAVVGGGSVVFRAARGKPSISSNMQAANANVPVDLPGYTFVGIGNCQDAAQKPYPQVIFKGGSVETAQLCATKCEECVVGPGGFTFVGFYYYTFGGEAGCSCLVSQTDPRVDFSQFRDDGICKADDTDNNSSVFSGTGPISSARPGTSSTCYKVGGGGGSKSGKTKRSKAPKSTN